MVQHKRPVGRKALIVLPVGDLARERRTNPAYAAYLRKALLRFDVEGTTEAIRQRWAQRSLREAFGEQEPSH